MMQSCAIHYPEDSIFISKIKDTFLSRVYYLTCKRKSFGNFILYYTKA